MTVKKHSAVMGWASLCLLLAVAAWWWHSRSIELDEQGYGTAIALYSVCNQRDVERLSMIENLLRHGAGETAGTAAAERALTQIITEARAGRWEVATRACRNLLDQQSTR